MKKKKLLSVLVAAALSCSLFSAVPVVSQAVDTSGVTMYRLYNRNSGEHFYTKDASEKSTLVRAGWKDEGIGWIAPVSSNTPVYRLYNENAGDHHYTLDSKEKDNLVTAGWKSEGIGWYSDDDKTVPLYREYNPNAVSGTHNYTTDKAEHDRLVAAGWKDEEIGWYAVSDGKNDPIDEPEDPKEPEEPKKPEDMLFPNAKIGDMVVLGSCEQDNDLTNGSEPIEWQYIADRDGHKLLLSKYVLDCKRYNESSTEITWENCTLRSWLNNDFYNTAFSASDKAGIMTSHNENPDTYELYKPINYGIVVNGAEGGNSTDDKVFLLSWTEARDYLDGKFGADNHNPKLLCSPTAYAKAQGVVTYGDSDDYYSADTAGDCCCWWLRSPGNGQFAATHVSGNGSLDALIADSVGVGVRPAILID